MGLLGRGGGDCTLCFSISVYRGRGVKLVMGSPGIGWPLGRDDSPRPVGLFIHRIAELYGCIL